MTKSATYHYVAYGAFLCSDLALRTARPTVIPSDAVPVEVRIGAVPLHLSEPTGRGVLFEASHGQYLLTVPGVARYWAQGGSRIDVEPASDAEMHRVEGFLLTSALSAVLHQRGVLVLHGSAVCGSAGAVLIAGDSGSGKSTTCAALSQLGYPVVTDDVAAVDVRNRPAVHSGLNGVRLWADAARELGLDVSAGTRVAPSREKFNLDVACTAAEVPLAAICCLDVGDVTSVTVSELEGTARFAAIRRFTRMRLAMEGMNMQAAHFTASTRLSASVPCYSITRPRSRRSLNDVVARIREWLG